MKPTTKLETRYLMTLHALLEAPQRMSTELRVYNCRAGGWIRGPHIRGDIVSPSGDWLRVMPNGTERLVGVAPNYRRQFTSAAGRH